MKLANALSYVRVPLAAGVVWAAWLHYWPLALALLLVAAATDALDGMAAQKYGGSPQGEFIDMICDLAMTVGAIAGLLLGGIIGWMPIIIGGTIAAVVQIINSFFRETVLFRRFGVWFMPCYFLAVLWVLMVKYALLGLSAAMFGSFMPIFVVITWVLMAIKRDRFKAWFSGRTH